MQLLALVHSQWRNCLLPLVQQKDTMCILKYTSRSGVDLRQQHQIHISIVTIIVLRNLVSGFLCTAVKRGRGRAWYTHQHHNYD